MSWQGSVWAPIASLCLAALSIPAYGNEPASHGRTDPFAWNLTSQPGMPEPARLVPLLQFGSERRNWFIGTQLAPVARYQPRPSAATRWQARFGGGLVQGRATFVLDLSHNEGLALTDQLALALTAKYQF
ncbi:hypothetical protein [Ferrimonas pelagia]|uniref:Uncharacterized protein n=1 Tax=Ferrimonas pelagia TaxID=1177826 RepID=A0ABP9FA60_9GAMM